MLNVKYLMSLFFVMCIALSATYSRAEPVKNLYQSEQLVAKSLALPGAVLIKSGMKQVLMKVSGSPGAADIVDELPSVSAHYLREFRLESTREVVTDAQRNDYLAQRLVLQFEPEAINSLLSGHGIKPLGKYRPRLLIWLLGDVDNATFVGYKKVILEHAAALAFPADVVLDQGRKLKQNNERLSDRIRYRTKAFGKVWVVVVSIDSDNRFVWRLPDLDDSPWHSVKGRFVEEVPSVFQLWIESSGIKVVSQDAIYLNTQQITVTSVKNVADYAAIMEYVLSLSSIYRVEVVSLSHEVLTLSVQSPLKVAALTQVLSLDSRMMLMRLLQGGDAISLRWRWIGTRGK
ncbi:DUF2066 domain-containing protein [Neptunomonas qingdaonensis]|uniref:DUF2066 domain-containing protein n=1 Tax=Neptunomonas qingdaonensis TaxID=1045558 RepID=UPI001160D57F|nr:DUF2066 domain-containing protein [Neptunomonas qingdaonensis]